MNLASVIDHTVLLPDCTLEDIEALCDEAHKYRFASVCVPPYFVNAVARRLEKSPVRISTVIGFPMGYACTAAKVEEIKRAIEEGADELDVVINICAVKNSNWAYVKNDIDSVTMAAHSKGKVVKIIIEAALLEKEEITQLCEICNQVGVNFVKTSTGMNGIATVEIVSELRAQLNNEIKIKAFGGIQNKTIAEALIEAGAARLGTSSGVSIIKK